MINVILNKSKHPFIRLF